MVNGRNSDNFGGPDVVIVELERSGAVAKVILNRPERMNALVPEMREGIAARFTELAADDSVRAVILTAAGPNFCASGDVSKMGEFTPASAMMKTRFMRLPAA